MRSVFCKIGVVSIALLWTGCSTSQLPRQSSQRIYRDLNASGIYHQVKPGQTLWRIAKAYSVDVQTLAQVNHLSNANALEVNQKLYIPGATQEHEVSSRCPCGPEPTKFPRNSPASSSAVQVVKEVFSHSHPRQVPLVHKDISVIWPVQGEISRNFEQDGMRRHDGIDITAPQGTPIVAAADGKVLFSDWGPGGYGLLVIVRHEDDIVTIYAHNAQNLVAVDQHVRQGEPIATVGRSGRATGNHLHFEIRYRTVPVSPYKFLPPQHQNIALLDGYASETRP